MVPNFTCPRMMDTASNDVVHVDLKRANDVLEILQSSNLEDGNTVDGDISGHTSVFIFHRVCFVT